MATDRFRQRARDILQRYSWRLANALDDLPDIEEALDEMTKAHEEENRRKTAATLRMYTARINWW